MSYELETVLFVACPFCHMPPGKSCADGSFTMPLFASHRARITAARKQAIS